MPLDLEEEISFVDDDPVDDNDEFDLCEEYTPPLAPRRSYHFTRRLNQEEMWLKNAGLGQLLPNPDNFGGDEADMEVMFKSLSQRQSETVRRRVHSLSKSWRDRRAQNVNSSEFFKRFLDHGEEATGENTSSDEQDSLTRLHRRGCVLRPCVFDTLTEPAVEEEADEFDFANPLQPPQLDPALPCVNVKTVTTGVTRIGDLDESTDMKKVRNHSHIQLATIIDENNIKMPKLKPRRQPENKALSLDDERVRTLVIRVLSELRTRRCLQTDGILRVPGSVTRVRQLLTDFEVNGIPDLRSVPPHDLSSCVKQILKHQPILSENGAVFQSIVIGVTHPSWDNSTRVKNQLKAFNLLVIQLQQTHQAILKALLECCYAIVENSDLNRMNLDNVATVMAPCILGMPRNSEVVVLSEVIKLLINYHEVLWTIPGWLVDALRRQNRIERLRRSKEKSGFFKSGKRLEHRGSRSGSLFKSSEDNMTRAIDYNAPHIAVHVMMTKTDTDVYVDRQTTVGQVIETVAASNSMYATLDLCLYEEGGDVTSRRLARSAVVLDILVINPAARWVLSQCAQAHSR